MQAAVVIDDIRIPVSVLCNTMEDPTEFNASRRARAAEIIGYDIQFYNGLNRSVWIRLRSGLYYHIRSGTNSSYAKSGHLTVESSINAPTGIVEFDRVSANINCNPSHEWKHHTKKIHQLQEDRRQSMGSVPKYYKHSLLYHFDEAQLLDNDGSIYSDELDIVISLRDHNSHQHPYSNVGKQLVRNKTAKDKVRKHIEYGSLTQISFVDNEDIRGSLFYPSPHGVVEIKPVMDLTRQSGIYIISSELKVGKRSRKGNAEVIEHHFSFEEAKKDLWFFEKADDALFYMDHSVNDLHAMSIKFADRGMKQDEIGLKGKEIEFREKELTFKEKEIAFKEQERILELRRTEMDNKDKEREAESKRLERERETLAKDIMSRRSIQGDTIKTITIILTSIIGFMAVIAKNK